MPETPLADSPETPRATATVTSREASHGRSEPGRVTLRAFLLGWPLAAGLAALNCWIETLANVHFLGGVQMPFGAVFTLAFFVLAVNGPLRALSRFAPRVLSPLSGAELLTIYAMLVFAALISTPGTDNFFITTGPTLFYYSTRENGWANLFYQHVPAHFAPGWNGQTYQREVIEPLYTGGLSPAQIPWHAWSAMLLAWSVFLLLVYSLLFWTSLLFRRQWIESEALAFPLVQLPLQMVEADPRDGHAPAAAFWGNRTLWLGVGVAAFLHLLRGLNNYYPDWPVIAGFQGNRPTFSFAERPWNVIGNIYIELLLGGIGIAFLLTREVSFSFWFFFLLQGLQLVVAEQLGFPALSLPRDAYTGKATFLAFQSVGGWAMMAALLVWAVRRHVWDFVRHAFRPSSSRITGEPFAPGIVLAGFVLSLGGLLAWSWFSGINALTALAFLGIYLMASLVLARLVVEGGLIFPQLTFSPLEWMTTGLFGASAIGPGDLTRLSFMQPVLMSDTRTNLLPGFLHTLKIAHAQELGPRGTRRLLGAVAVAIVTALAVTTYTSIATLYAAGGLSAYTWSTLR